MKFFAFSFIIYIEKNYEAVIVGEPKDELFS